MQPQIFLFRLYEFNLVPIVIVFRVLRAEGLIQSWLHTQVEDILESSNLFRELLWCQFVDRG